MSLKETLLKWNEAATKFDGGNPEEALAILESECGDSSKIMFNIGSIQLRLQKYSAAISAFSSAVAKDEHLAVAYFQRGIAYALQSNYEMALEDFDEAVKRLRGNDRIDYTQLGMAQKLYMCELLYNRGLALAGLDDMTYAKEDLASAIEWKREVKHQSIDSTLASMESGSFRVSPSLFFTLEDDTIFRPPKDKINSANTVFKAQKSKVVAAVRADDTYTGFSGRRLLENAASGNVDAARQLLAKGAQTLPEYELSAPYVPPAAPKAPDLPSSLLPMATPSSNYSESPAHPVASSPKRPPPARQPPPSVKPMPSPQPARSSVPPPKSSPAPMYANSNTPAAPAATIAGGLPRLGGGGGSSPSLRTAPSAAPGRPASAASASSVAQGARPMSTAPPAARSSSSPALKVGSAPAAARPAAPPATATYGTSVRGLPRLSPAPGSAPAMAPAMAPSPVQPSVRAPPSTAPVSGMASMSIAPKTTATAAAAGARPALRSVGGGAASSSSSAASSSAGTVSITTPNGLKRVGPPPVIPAAAAAEPAVYSTASASAGGQKLKIKCHFKDTRVIQLASDATFDELCKMVDAKFGVSGLTLQYKDDDGDLVLLTDQGDLDMARETLGERMQLWCIQN